MSAPAAACPGCGAPLKFQWSSAVQTTCPYCRSIVVRHDVDLEKVGEVADLPLTPSPIQLGTTGRHGRRAFTVTGRIVYEWERGGWNEWHLAMADGGSGWLSDAQLEYAVSYPKEAKGLPDAGAVKPGDTIRIDGRAWRVTVRTTARYLGVEGELPFEYWDKSKLSFVDLAGEGTAFGTIDYSEVPPLLFVGEHVAYDALQLQNVRRFEGW